MRWEQGVLCGGQAEKRRTTSLWCPCYGDDARRPASISVGVMNTLIPIFSQQKDSSVFPEPNKFERRLEKKQGEWGSGSHLKWPNEKQLCERVEEKVLGKRRKSAWRLCFKCLRPEELVESCALGLNCGKSSICCFKVVFLVILGMRVGEIGFDWNVVDVPEGINHHLKTPSD